MKNLARCAMVAVLMLGAAVLWWGRGVQASGGPAETALAGYRVLVPIESGNLQLFAVVRSSGRGVGTPGFLTLDEGLASGEVEVTEAGKVRGLVRTRPEAVTGLPRREDPARRFPMPVVAGGSDQVNTLVLINHSKRPLLLLAGEIVTGGKQDRVIGKDRIVPAGADPIELGVFCIEHGRWTESSAKFGASAKSPAAGIMVQPMVRQSTMAAQNQQQVWDSVNEALAEVSPYKGSRGGGLGVVFGDNIPAMASLGTTSYAKAMQDERVASTVNGAAAPILKGSAEVLSRLREEQAIGVVVAVRGEIVWADLFASTDLLARYWTKLVRSYAAESLAGSGKDGKATVAAAEQFLQQPMNGTESSTGERGVYRYWTNSSQGAATFVLESLLAEAAGVVHVSRMKLRGAPAHDWIEEQLYR